MSLWKKFHILANVKVNTLFCYKHELYKHTQTEKALKIKHLLSIIRVWDLI